MKLYTSWFCPFAQRAWIAVEEPCHKRAQDTKRMCLLLVLYMLNSAEELIQGHIVNLFSTEMSRKLALTWHLSAIRAAPCHVQVYTHSKAGCWSESLACCASSSFRDQTTELAFSWKVCCNIDPEMLSIGTAEIREIPAPLCGLR